ncbi:hypothetical protein HIM_01555 [Hirsutella minnesotensis 3608]|nr:hypothetical protein HIM_01555 [Hirsutella minnesotensis 3608]
MRFHLSFLHVALWPVIVFAFHPFQPDWHQGRVGPQALAQNNGDIDAKPALTASKHAAHDSSASSSGDAAEGAARLSSKYGGSLLVNTMANDAVVKTSNKYPVQEAVDPKQPKAAGVSQDGTDYAYFVKVKLGSKKKQLYMLIDTGAGSSWVMGSNCTDEACSKHDTFGAADSDTFRDSSKDFSVSYGTGTVSGKLATDTIEVAGMSFEYTFGLASKTSPDFVNFPFDGILGMAMSRGKNDNFLDKLAGSHNLDKNIFSIALNRATDGVNHGEIMFGNANQERYTGDITYSPLTAKGGEWGIQIDDIAFDGKKAQIGGVQSFIDTGTSFIFGPKDKVQTLHDLIPGAKSSDGQTYTVPCTMDKALTFTFSGVDYKVWPQDWMSPKNSAGECTSNIYGHDVAKGAWLVGDTFLMNVYTVFDKDQQRIGFANLAETNSTSNAASDQSTGTKSGPDSASTDATKPGSPGGGISGHESEPGKAPKSDAVGGHRFAVSGLIVGSVTTLLAMALM